MRSILPFLLLLPSIAHAASSPPWFQLRFQNPHFNELGLFYLGHAYDGSADVAEVLKVLAQIDERDPESWAREWQKEATRLVTQADADEKANHPLSAAEYFLRAATYTRAALHYHHEPQAPEVAALAQQEVRCFKKFLTLSRSPCQAVSIPYQGTTLPGYFCKAPGAQDRAPVLIFQEGRDGWAEDGLFFLKAALARGFHVLLFDGPGMGQVIRLQNLPFRPDWDQVITPVVDYVLSRPETDPDKIALMAVSMGGFLGPQAATKEHRIKVLIANPGVSDWYANVEKTLNQVDPNLLPLLDSRHEDQFNSRIHEIMEGNSFLRWGLKDFMWHHGVASPAELIRDLRKYRLGRDDLARITARTLVVDAEDEPWGQSEHFFAAIQSTTCSDYLKFRRDQGAQFHVQPGASAVASSVLMNWLQDAFASLDPHT